MKLTQIIMFLIVVGCSNRIFPPPHYTEGTSKDFSFQVLFSSNAFNQFEDPLEKFENIEIGEQLILKNGHLILVHSSGKFIEFEGDTTVNINLINKNLIESFNLIPNKLKPDLKYLWNSTNGNFGAVSDGIYSGQIFISNPWPIQIPKITDQLCINWKTEEINQSYMVRIRNIFDELIDEIETGEQSIELDLTKYENIPSNLFVVDVYCKNNPSVYTQTVGVSIGNMDFMIPQMCEIKTAIESLEIAYHMERYYYLVDDAEEFYILAAELSKYPIYFELLENYKKRYNRGL